MRSRGLTLVEVTVALLIFLIALLALAQASASAIILNMKNRDLMKVSTMCVDKSEQLLGLSFTDVTTNTTVEPTGDPLTYPATGTGLCVTTPCTSPCATPPCSRGSVAPDPLQTGYFDYLDFTGQRVAATDPNARFIRQWRITQTSTGIKVIEVTVTGDPRAAAYQFAKTVTYKSR